VIFRRTCWRLANRAEYNGHSSSTYSTLQPPPPLRIDTPSFTLRAWSAGDAKNLRATLDVSDAHLRTFTPWVVDGKVPGLSLQERLERHAQAFDSGAEWVYGMFGSNGDEILGGCGLYPRVGPASIEIGYWLAVHHTGRGLATAAAAELTRVAFAADDIDAVEIHCAPTNVASGRVPQRLGFRIHRSEGNGTGEVIVWRLTRSEFAELDSFGQSEII
jgi:RimJ/RimL family protein N-acetyltransferase